MPVGRYPTQSKASVSAQAGSKLSRIPAEAFLAPAPLLPAVTPVLEPEVAALVAAAEVGSGGLLTPVVVGAALGVGLGLIILNYTKAQPGTGNPEGWAHPDYCYYKCPTDVGGPYTFSRSDPKYPVGPGCTGPGSSDCGSAGFPSGVVITMPPDNAYTNVSVYRPASEVGGPDTEMAGVYWLVNSPTTADLWHQVLPKPGLFVVPSKFYPNEAPEELPIMQPIGVPAPQTWDDAVAEPGTQPDSPTKPQAPVEAPVYPFPVAIDVPPGRTITVPDQVIEIGPGTGTGGSVGTTNPPIDLAPPPKGPPRPPERGTKERKPDVWANKGTRIVWGLGNSATEVLEFLDDLFRALPKECKPNLYDGSGKRRPYTPLEKAFAVYACAEHMDLAQALTNVINDQLHDMFYGKIGQTLGKASKNLGIITGLQHILRQEGSLFGLDGVDTHVPLPTLQLTPDGKSWELVIK